MNVSDNIEKVVSTLSTYFVNLPRDRMWSGIQHALKTVGEFAGVAHIGLYMLHNESDTEFTVREEWYNADVSQKARTTYTKILKESPHIIETIRKGDSVQMPPSKSENADSQAFLAIPLSMHGEVMGFITYAHADSEHMWTSEMLRALRLLGELIANVLEREESEEIKSEFLADVSHELRTPLTVMRSTIDVARRELEQGVGSVEDVFRVLEGEIKYLDGIIGDLSLLAHAPSKIRVIGEYEPVNIAELCGELIDVFHGPAKKKNIDLRLVKVPDVIVVGEKTLLYKAFRNVVANAIQYGKENGWVEIEGYVKNSMIYVDIKDNGLGIPKENIPYLFTRFYRVERSRSRTHGGTGLGLALAQFVIQAHGGNITVKSTNGEGSTFTLMLPVDKA